MNPDAEGNESHDADDEGEVNRLICESLTPVPMGGDHRESLRGRLMDRIGDSLAAHAGLLTVRVRDGLWRSVKAGVRVKSLWDGRDGSSVLIELAPGAVLPVHRHRHVEEGIVLRGGLQMGDLDMGPGDYHVSPPGSRHGRIGSRQGALAYLRGTSLGHTTSLLGELIGGLLPAGGPPPHTVFVRDGGWVPLADGVEKRDLRVEREAVPMVSRFLRFAPGARLPGHDHGADEECMMLEGEVFLGDILLRAGEFQMAPAGSRHGEFHSDTGALIFVRGADPMRKSQA